MIETTTVDLVALGAFAATLGFVLGVFATFALAIVAEHFAWIRRQGARRAWNAWLAAACFLIAAAGLVFLLAGCAPKSPAPRERWFLPSRTRVQLVWDDRYHSTVELDEGTEIRIVAQPSARREKFKGGF